jgi:YD repeat-containing protein
MTDMRRGWWWSQQWGYDELGQMTSHRVGTAAPTTYVYPAGQESAGRLTQMVTNEGTTTYTYDELGRLTQAGGPQGVQGYQL